MSTDMRTRVLGLLRDQVLNQPDRVLLTERIVTAHEIVTAAVRARAVAAEARAVAAEAQRDEAVEELRLNMEVMRDSSAAKVALIKRAAAAEATVEQVRAVCQAQREWCSTERLDVPPWVATVEAALPETKP